MKHIALLGRTGKYTDGKEYLKVSEDLEFEIDKTFKNSEVYYIANNGVSTRKGKVNDNKFSIPVSFLRLGSLSIKIEVVSNENAEEYIVEDLLIMEIGDRIETIPEVDKLKAQVETYSKLVDKLQRKNEILTKLVGGLYDTEIKVDNRDEWVGKHS